MRKQDYEITERVPHNGATRVTILIGDERYTRDYYGYSKRDAVRKAWNTMPPVAYYAHDPYYHVLGIDYDITDYLVLRDRLSRVTIHAVRYTTAGNAYIVKHGHRLNLDDMLKTYL